MEKLKKAINYYCYYDSPVGKINIVKNSEDKVTNLMFYENLEQIRLLKFKKVTLNNEHFKNEITQLEEYFKGKRKKFDIEICFEYGSEFQKDVWREVLKIPYGETSTYKNIAESINNPKAVRAVGSANSFNPIPIIVPCHRVIKTNGSLGGYSAGVEIKKFLLNLESNSTLS